MTERLYNIQPQSYALFDHAQDDDEKTKNKSRTSAVA